MNKRALLILTATVLFPALALAAPVKRIKFKGKAAQAHSTLYGEKTNDRWTTPVTITQSGSTVTIKFRQFNGKSAGWMLGKVGTGWGYQYPTESVTPPSEFFYYCETSGQLAAVFNSKRGTLVSLLQMDCYDGDNNKWTEYDVFTTKLAK